MVWHGKIDIVWSGMVWYDKGGIVRHVMIKVV